jgi:hypothetical protein
LKAKSPPIAIFSAQIDAEARMRVGFRLASLIIPSFIIFVSSTRADEIRVGTSLLCNTQQQVERFITLYDGDAIAAATMVNAEERDENACGMVTMAFMPGPPLATARAKDVTFQIIPIIVLGVLTSDGIQAVEPTHSFSLLQVDERDA